MKCKFSFPWTYRTKFDALSDIDKFSIISIFQFFDIDNFADNLTYANLSAFDNFFPIYRWPLPLLLGGISIYLRGISVVRAKYHVAWYGLSKVGSGYHRGPDGPVLISCGAEYNAHAADTIKPTPAEALVHMMMIIILAPVFTQNINLLTAMWKMLQTNKSWRATYKMPTLPTPSNPPLLRYVSSWWWILFWHLCSLKT